jgi:hypothetical protein
MIYHQIIHGDLFSNDSTSGGESEELDNNVKDEEDIHVNDPEFSARIN